VRLGCLDLSKKRLEQTEHSLDVVISLGDPFEVIDLTMALDATAKEAVQSEEDLGYNARRAVLRG
jgi:hypothetical protein